jgi:hypothetical protein
MRLRSAHSSLSRIGLCLLETLICLARVRLDGRAFAIDSEASRPIGFEQSKVEGIRLELQFADLMPP